MTTDVIFLYAHSSAQLNHHQKGFLLQQVVLTQKPTTGQISETNKMSKSLREMSISHVHQGLGDLFGKGKGEVLRVRGDGWL